MSSTCPQTTYCVLGKSCGPSLEALEEAIWGGGCGGGWVCGEGCTMILEALWGGGGDVDGEREP